MENSKPTYEELEKRIKELEQKNEIVAQNIDLQKTIEELQIAKAKVEENEILYRTLIETSIDGVVLTDLSGKYIFCNEKHAELLGYNDVNEIIGTDGYNYFDPKDIEGSK